MLLIHSLIFIAILLGVAYKRLPITQWTLIIGVTLLALTIFKHLSGWILFFSWIIYLAVAVLFNTKELRVQYLSLPMLKFFKKALPPMSQTESEALDAGDVWWDGELFQGQPNWDKLYRYGRPELTSEEQEFYNTKVKELGEMVNDWEINTQSHDLPEAVWNFLKKEKFFGIVIGKEYGGLGFSALAHAKIVSRICTRSVTAAVTTMVPNSLGPGELIHKYGTLEQKNYYLPRLAVGDEIPCFALTGNDAGSDAAAMTDFGIACLGEFNGKTVTGIRLTWDKRYITLAPVATVLGLAFKLFDPEHLLGDKEEIGITLCLLPTNHPGVEIGKRHYPSMIPFMNGPTRGKDVFIPMDWIIGGEKMIGQGWRMLMECLSIGRAISLPANSTSAGQLACYVSGAYARVRKQFKTSIGNFEGVQEALSQIGGFTYMLNACQLMTAQAVDLGIKPAVASAIAKYHMTEMYRKAINLAMDIHGGRAVQAGPKNYLFSAYMAVPVGITVEGANILTRNLIIFGQGAVRCHPYIRDEMAAVNLSDEQESLTQFDKLLTAHIGYSVSNIARSLVQGLTGGYFNSSPLTGKLAKYGKQINRMSAALAMATDIAMLVLGGALKRKERLSARLGDVLSNLYLASAVIKYYADLNQPVEDLPFMRWTLLYCLNEIQLAFDSFFANFPNKIVGWLMKKIIFPWGRAYHGPSDSLGRLISKAMMEPSPFRDRLTESVFTSHDENHPLNIIENALEKMIQTEGLMKKFSKIAQENKFPRYLKFEQQVELAFSQQLIELHEKELLLDFEKARVNALSVDEFDFNYFKGKK